MEPSTPRPLLTELRDSRSKVSSFEDKNLLKPFKVQGRFLAKRDFGDFLSLPVNGHTFFKLRFFKGN